MQYSVNQAAVRLVKDAIARSEEMQITSWQAECGSTLVDMGLDCPGSWKAAKVFIEAGLGGMGTADFGHFELGSFCLPAINVWTDHPVLAVVASQAGCWQLGEGEFAVVGSGPARAVALADRWSQHGYRDEAADEVVIQLQTTRIPNDDLCTEVARACNVPPEKVYVVFAPTASLVGTAQVASRTVEQVMIKLLYHGFDVHTVRTAFGTAPVSPLSRDETEAVGRANDCLVYGATTVLYADTSDEAIQAILAKLCFDVYAGEYWGMPFAEIFDHFGRNWFAVPDVIDSPAKVIINSLQTGHSFLGGQINRQALHRSFFGTDLPDIAS